MDLTLCLASLRRLGRASVSVQAAPICLPPAQKADLALSRRPSAGRAVCESSDKQHTRQPPARKRPARAQRGLLLLFATLHSCSNERIVSYSYSFHLIMMQPLLPQRFSRCSSAQAALALSSPLNTLVGNAPPPPAL